MVLWNPFKKVFTNYHILSIFEVILSLLFLIIFVLPHDLTRNLCFGRFKTLCYDLCLYVQLLNSPFRFLF